MHEDKYVLGIDTSNYKTSAALVSRNKIIYDLRKLLNVKKGERGLRQSEALFQHVKNLPDLFGCISSEYKSNICAVSYSVSPRPLSDSYMPCFLAGSSAGRSAASLLDVPAICFSHQEGHIEAVRAFANIREDNYIACHFSGGTCEVLAVKSRDNISDNRSCTKALDKVTGSSVVDGRNMFFDIDILGGSKDISFGQVLDRAGVLMGLEFPAGAKMDEMALAAGGTTDILTRIKVENAMLNLSGIDTQIKNCLLSKKCPVTYDPHYEKDFSRDGAKGTDYSPISEKSEFIKEFTAEIFDKISSAIYRLLRQASEISGLKTIIMSGGVSASAYIRGVVTSRLQQDGIKIYFGSMDLSSDNAVGIAMLGGRYIWD